MKNTFDLKKFLVENKLTENSRLLNEEEITDAHQLEKLLIKDLEGTKGEFKVIITHSPSDFSEYLDKYARKGRDGKFSIIKSPLHLAETITIFCRDNNYERVAYTPVGSGNTVGYLKAENDQYTGTIFMEVYPPSQL